MRTETIYHLPQRRRDRDGDYVGDESEEVPIYGVVIWPRASEEKDGGEVNIDGQNLACPDSEAARAVRSDAQIRLRGELHKVSEPPARYPGKRILIKTLRVTT